MKHQLPSIPGCRIREFEPMARYTSFRIGGPARYFVSVYSVRALMRILKACQSTRMRVFVLGAGTNILCDDHGYPGIVLSLKGYFMHLTSEGDHYICGAAVKLNTLIATACSQGYGGAEFLTGIPGTLGGAIYCNAGAFGQAIGEIIEQVRVVTFHGKIKEISGDRIDFQYRHSGLPRGMIIISARICFTRKKISSIRKQLEQKKKYRQEHQPQGYSAGSYFKNPRPLSAGKIIDECGLKGASVGQAWVSTKHANWIINRGGATALDVLKLAAKIKRAVRKQTGIQLIEEVRRLK